MSDQNYVEKIKRQIFEEGGSSDLPYNSEVLLN
jgi:hypothetical protein